MAESGKIRVRLVTPERILFEEMVDAVQLPARSGYIEVLYGHAPLLAELGAGDVTLYGGSGEHSRYNVSWGFVEVLPERVTILANRAVLPSTIDTAVVRLELAEGERMWHSAGDSAEAYAEAGLVITDAEARLSSAISSTH